jgi:hypothetical protein
MHCKDCSFWVRKEESYGECTRRGESDALFRIRLLDDAGTPRDVLGAGWMAKDQWNPVMDAVLFTDARFGCVQFAPKGQVNAQAYVDAWNELCGKLARVTKLTVDRRRKVHARAGEGLTLENFRQAAELCSRTPFLIGLSKEPFYATFDWLIQNDTYWPKVLEGAYGVPFAKPKSKEQLAAEKAEKEQKDAQLYEDFMRGRSEKLAAGTRYGPEDVREIRRWETKQLSK